MTPLSYIKRGAITGVHYCLCFICLVSICLPALSQQVVVYPQPESNTDERTNYPIALLRLCEQKSGGQFILQPSLFHAQQGRYLRQLAQGHGIDVVWSLTSKEREEELLPVRIPIDRGLLGWRLLLIRSIDQPLFSDIHLQTELSKLRAGLGHDWPDVDVFKANNLNVSTGSTYEGLFKMLAFNHIQYFPRAVSEIWPELEDHQELALSVESTLAIHYPSAFYFFVNKNNTQLAATLESCLKEATQDGSLRKLFNNYFQTSIERAQLSKRKIINLANPALPSSVPTSSREYWYSPMETK